MAQAEPEALRLLAPKGPDRNRQSQNQQLQTSHPDASLICEEKHTSGIVKLRVPPRQSRGNSHFIRLTQFAKKPGIFDAGNARHNRRDFTTVRLKFGRAILIH